MFDDVEYDTWIFPIPIWIHLILYSTHCQTMFTCLHLRLRELVDGEGGALVEVVPGVGEVDEAPASLHIHRYVLPVPAGGPLQLNISHSPTSSKGLV